MVARSERGVSFLPLVPKVLVQIKLPDVNGSICAGIWSGLTTVSGAQGCL